MTCDYPGCREQRADGRLWCRSHVLLQLGEARRAGGARVLRMSDYERDALTGWLHRPRQDARRR